MRSRFVSGLLQMALLLLSACGAGFPDAPTAETAIALPPDADTTALTAFTEQHRWTCADCARLTDVGLRNECQTCCAAGAGAFQGCDVRGNVFDPLTCRCVATPPGDSRLCGGIFCPAGGDCCHAGTAPFVVEFCELPGSTIPSPLQPYTTCTPICPAGTRACRDTCHDLLTDAANCGTCGHACGPRGLCQGGTCCTPRNACNPGECGLVADGCGGTLDCGNPCTGFNTCGGGGVPNLCGCTALTAAQICTAGRCGQFPNGCGGTVDCGNSCTGTGQTCGGGGVPNQCGCTPTTCAAQGASCGPVANGCGATLNCGSCTSQETCQNGICVSNCPPGYTTCNGACVNAHVDTSNCGACGNTCASVQVCIGGACGDYSCCICTTPSGAPGSCFDSNLAHIMTEQQCQAQCGVVGYNFSYASGPTPFVCSYDFVAFSCTATPACSTNTVGSSCGSTGSCICEQSMEGETVCGTNQVPPVCIDPECKCGEVTPNHFIGCAAGSYCSAAGTCHLYCSG